MGIGDHTHRNQMSKNSLIKIPTYVCQNKTKAFKKSYISRVKFLSWVPTLTYFKSLKKSDLPVTLVFLAFFFHILQMEQVPSAYAAHPPAREQSPSPSHTAPHVTDRPSRSHQLP